MKKLVLVAAIAATTFGAVSTAQAEVTTSANVGVYTDYRFRGVSQTNNDFALQGGFDVDFGNGFYVGNWNSNVSFGANSLEMDFYGGYAGEFANGIAYDAGLLYYYYPNTPNNTGLTDADTLEAYGSLGYKGLTASLNVSLTDDYFALQSITNGVAQGANSDLGGSTYFKLAYEYPISEALAFGVSYGITNYADDIVAIDGSALDSYQDYSVGLTYTAGKFTYGAAFVGTDDDGELVLGKDQGEADLILSISTSF